ncbi:uncharacterized protein N7503_002001 [Penicillium pulvis]|uniref:uncharacterized protein n=1 Tax=Penicillium pulvis TaxID=1562058 RepID=UPI002549531F|nr:uncharacterized protein N7503_002001 [Penicillium pulvis]KAJ5809783.1 hypothetical protein N7503_002001 [Penicillium pulvis]
MASSASSIQQEMIGTWTLLDYRTSAKPPKFPLGPNATGMLIFTPDGFMSAHIMEPGARLFEESGPHSGTDPELADAMRHSVAYSGRYQISTPSKESSSGILETVVVVAPIPNWVGSIQEREAKMVDGQLVLSPTVQVSEVCIT